MDLQLTLPHPKYRPDIDGLRAVAVLSVVLYHSFPGYVRGGFIGVDIFFVISGYLISVILFESFNKKSFSFTEFYYRRIRRIFPAVIVVLTGILIFGWFALLSDEYKQLGKHIASSAGFVLNLIILNEVDYFNDSAEKNPLLHLWSLGVEEQFYIFWPVILYSLSKINYRFLIIILSIIFLSFVINLVSVTIDPIITFYSPHTRIWEFLFGGLLAWSVVHKKYFFSNFNNKIYAKYRRHYYNYYLIINRNTLSNMVIVP